MSFKFKKIAALLAKNILDRKRRWTENKRQNWNTTI